MNRFKYAIFDLDGTLLDTRKGVISAAIQTIKRYKRRVPQREILEGLIGPPMQESFRMLYDLSKEEAMEMANAFRRSYMADEFLFRATPYEGIYDLMEALTSENMKIGVATYKREDYAKRLLCNKGFDKYTKYMFGSDLEGKLKKVDIIRLCLHEMGCIDYQGAVYIGDGKSDGEGANLIGISFIAVTYGFGFKSDADAGAYAPYAVAHDCYELKCALLPFGIYPGKRG